MLRWAQPKLIKVRTWNFNMLYMLACWVYVYKNNFCMTSGFVFTSGFVIIWDTIACSSRKPARWSTPRGWLASPGSERGNRLALSRRRSRPIWKVKIRPKNNFALPRLSVFMKSTVLLDFGSPVSPGERSECPFVNSGVCRSDCSPAKRLSIGLVQCRNAFLSLLAYRWT